jgi:O-antigen/teichoic acid export membrane protein
VQPAARDQEPAHRHLTQVARGGLVSLVGAVVAGISGFVLVLVVANLSSADTAGTLFSVTSVIVLLAALASLGSDTGLARFLLRFEATGRSADNAAVIRTAFRAPLVLSALVGGALVVAAAPLSDVLGLGEGGPGCLVVAGVTLPFVTLSVLALAGTRAFGRMLPTVTIDSIGRSAFQPAAAAAAGLVGAGSIALTAAWSLPYAVAGVLSAYVFFRYRAERAQGYPDLEPSAYRVVRREFWSFTWPRAITKIAQTAIQRLDIILIAALLTPTDAALYTAATRFVALGQSAVQAMQQVLQPKFTHLLATRQDDVLRHVYRIGAAWSMAVSWPLYVVVGLLPLAYLGAFGPEYAAGAGDVVLYMVAAMMFGVAAGAADTLLLMAGRSGLSLGNAVAALAVDVVLCLVLIPRMGISGAALAWFCAVVLRSGLALIQARVLLKVVSGGAAAVAVALAVGLAFLVPIGVLRLVTDLTQVQLVAVVPLCSVLYLGLLWVARSWLHLEVFRDALRRRRKRAA